MVSVHSLRWLIPDTAVGLCLLVLHSIAQGVNEIAAAATSVVALTYISLRLYRYWQHEDPPSPPNA
jgi:hypothetical protein